MGYWWVSQPIRGATVNPSRLLLVLSLTACSGDDSSKPQPVDEGTPSGGDGGDPGPDPYDVVTGPYEAEIRWTEHGVPHIKGETWASVSYGMGHAFARDHFCTLMDQVVMVNSQRARWHGPGSDDLNIHEDLGWLGLGVKAKAEAGWFELDEELQLGLVAYAAGVNDWREEVGTDGMPDPRCAGAPWVRDINHIDLLAYYLAFGLQGSGAVFVDAVGSATPPSSGRSTAAPVPPPPPISRTLELIKNPLLGSNGWALGSERTTSGRGMLLSNTHFPAVGSRQWHESHLTVPGEIDVYGVSLMGVPLINVGFTRHVAWTHTVSGAPRFIATMLRLDPDDPTRYNDGDGWRDMEETSHTIEVLEGDGGTRSVTKSTWQSSFGPVINAPVIGWNGTQAIAISDANDNNLAMPATWAAMNRAESLAELQDAQRTHLGIPWVHTMAADDQGQAWYIDSSAVPNWAPETIDAWEAFRSSDAIAAIFADFGVFVVPSDDPAFRWVEEPGAREPGLVPWDKMPQLTRDDFVFNANDNHWLTNPDELLTGYSALYGPDAAPRSPRTRMNARYLMETGEDSPSGEDGRFDLAELETAALSGRGMVAEELLDAVIERCNARRDGGPWRVDPGTGEEVDVDLGPGCDALMAWHGRVSTDAVGAVVWRELLGSGVFSVDDFLDAGALWDIAFDPSSPVDTPSGLTPLETAAVDEDPVLDALAIGLLRLDAAGIAADAALGDVQFLPRGDAKVPFPGGQSASGTIQIASYSSGASGTLLEDPQQASVVNSETDLTEDGYLVNYGNSFVMALEFTDEGPRARAITTYSQAESPASPHHADQSELYSTGVLRDVHFEEADIAAHTIETKTVSHP